MRIKKLRINGYGKFNDEELILGKGLTLVFGRNEAGKSTIQSFIKAMLFDFPRRNVDKEGRLPDLRKYKPWGGSVFGGMLELETDDGNVMKIERDFARRNTSVFDENLRDITSEFPYSKKDGLSLGETLLSMDRECFENTSFIKQGGTIVLQDDRKNLFEKLMNLSQTGSESTSVAVAKAALSTAITALGNNRTKNKPHNIASAEYKQLTSLMDSANQKHLDMADYSEKQLLLEKEINFLKIKAADYKTSIASAELTEEKAVLLGLKSKYDGYSEKIMGLSDEIFKASQLIEKYRLPANITEQELLDNIRITASAIEKQKNITGEDPEAVLAKLVNKKQRNRIWLALCYTGVTLTALLAILFHPAIFIATAIVTALLVYLHLKKPHYTESELLTQIKLVNECNHDLTVINAFIESAGYSKVKTFEEADELLKKLFDNKNQFATLENNIKRLKERKSDLENFRDSVPAQYSDISGIENALTEINRRLADYGASGNSTAQNTETDPQVELDIKQRELSGVKAVLSKYMQSDEEIAQIEESLGLCREKLDSIKAEIQAMELASELISQAAEKMQEEIIPKLNEKTGKLLSHITDGSHSTLATGIDNEINTEFRNAVHSLWEFSDGTIDQMYFALRIAAAEVFSEKESVPIIIDEAFAYYDEDRIKSTFDLLSEIAKEKQVIVFTCKEKEIELISEYKDANILRL